MLEGRQQGRQIVLSGVDHAQHDARVRVRWEPIPGGVREIATRSFDGGKHRQPMFGIVFRKHRP